MIMCLTLGLLFTGMFMYLPQHIAFLNSRAAYYLFGRDVSSTSAELLKGAASWGLNTSIASFENVRASLAAWGASSSTEL